MIPLEIGGGNGLQGLIIGASTNLDIPSVDGDWMGRAYPVSWQTTPVVFENKAVMISTCISDGNGRIMVNRPVVELRPPDTNRIGVVANRMPPSS